MNKSPEKKHDKALDITFPASDPVAPGNTTAHEETLQTS